MSAIHLYSYNKKINSTSTPFSGGINVTGTFRQPLDVLHPVVRIEDSTTYPLMTGKYNIAHITELNRWYWIRNVVWVTDKIAELHLDVDVLSTYKTAIGNSTQYVVRSASQYNADICDNMYPMRAAQDCVVNSITNIPWYSASGWELKNGWFIIGVLNDDSIAVGSTSYYAMNEIAFQDLRYQLFSSVSYSNMQFTQIEEQLYKSLFNPMQYITSCMWFPVQPDITGVSDISLIHFGFFDITLTANGRHCYRIKKVTKSGALGDLANVKHPQSTLRGTYLNGKPFLQRTIYIPPIGSIELDTSKMMGSTSVPTIGYWIDFVTGEVRVRLQCMQNASAIVGEGVGMLGVPMSLAQQTQDISGYYRAINQETSGALGAVGSAITGNVGGIVSGISETANGVINARSALAPNCQSLPGRGGLISGDMLPLDVTTYAFLANEDNADKGRPYCQAVQLNTLSGFIMCSNARIAISGAYLEEQQMIDNFLNTGFYYV